MSEALATISMFIEHGKRYKEIFKWVEDISTVQWSQENVHLNSDVSPITGYIDLSRTPHLIEILNDRDKHHVWFQSLLASTQVGKTMALFLAIFKELDTDPSMMQLTIPNDKGVADYITTKLDPMLKGVESLQIKIEEFKEDEKTRLKIARKQVGGGMLFILGNTASNRSSKTVKHMFIDEARLFGKGHITELIGRTKSFERFFRKIMVVSSLETADGEESNAYERCDCKKELSIFCPECEHGFYPGSKEFKFLKKSTYLKNNNITEDDFKIKIYKELALKEVYVECPECSCHISSTQKDKLIANGGVKFAIVEGDEQKTSIGYKANALCTYITEYETIATEIIDADGDVVVLQRIWRDYFNEIYNHSTDSAEYQDIWLLDSGTPELQVPPDTNKLFMSVDVQKNRIYIVIIAFSYDHNMTVIFKEEVKSFANQDWETAEHLFTSDYYDQEGNAYGIYRLGVDFRGYNQEDVLRIDEAKTFVKNMMIYLDEEGIDQDQQKAMGIYGFDPKKSEANRYKPFITPKEKTKIDEEVHDIPVIGMNNRVIKMGLSWDSDNGKGIIPRTIAKVRHEQGSYEPKDEDDDPSQYTKRLFYVNSSIIEHEKAVYAKQAKKSKNGVGSLPANEFSMHMTAEKYDPTEDKYVAERKRNDYYDCTCMIDVMIRESGIESDQRPDPSEIQDAYDAVSRYSSFNGG